MPSPRHPSSSARGASRATGPHPGLDAASSGIQPSLDWHRVVSAMLDHLALPALLVDPRGVVRVSNVAFAALTSRSVAELVGCDWSDLFEDDRAKVRERVLRGERVVELRSGPAFRHRLALRAKFLRAGPDASEAYILEVEASEPLEAGSGRSVHRERYTVSAAHHTRGTLLAVDDDAFAAAHGAGSACFRTIANRSEPCPGCPVFGDLSQLPARAVIVRDDAPGAYRVVEVDRRGDDALSVEGLTLREEVLSELIAAKIEWIARQSDLTPREREILTLLYLGRSTQEVASLLGISERTAKYHQANVLRKVGADSRVDLVRLLM